MRISSLAETFSRQSASFGVGQLGSGKSHLFAQVKTTVRKCQEQFSTILARHPYFQPFSRGLCIARLCSHVLLWCTIFLGRHACRTKLPPKKNYLAWVRPSLSPCPLTQVRASVGRRPGPVLGDLKITSTSTERQKRSQNLAPVLVISSVNSLAFSGKIITSTGFYRCCAPGASAPVVIKNQSPKSQACVCEHWSGGGIQHEKLFETRPKNV